MLHDSPKTYQNLAKNDLPLQWFGRIHWKSQQRWTAKLRELHGDPKLSRLLQSLGSRLTARVARDIGDSQTPNFKKNTWSNPGLAILDFGCAKSDKSHLQAY